MNVVFRERWKSSSQAAQLVISRKINIFTSVQGEITLFYKISCFCVFLVSNWILWKCRERQKQSSYSSLRGQATQTWYFFFFSKLAYFLLALERRVAFQSGLKSMLFISQCAKKTIQIRLIVRQIVLINTWGSTNAKQSFLIQSHAIWSTLWKAELYNVCPDNNKCHDAVSSPYFTCRQFV